MTNRERLVKTLQRRPADRAPFVWWLGFIPWGETHERWKKESGIADLDLVKYFGFEPYFQAVPIELGPFPHFEQKVLREDAEFVVSIDWRGITMRNRRDGHSMPDWIAHPVKTREDWTCYKAERLQPRLEERLARVDEFVKNAAAVDAPVQVGHFPWGVFGTPRDLLGAEEILIGFYTEPEMIRDMMETWVSLWLALYERVEAKVHINHIHIWEDMAGRQGSLISMAMVEEFMAPQYDRIVAFARRHAIEIVSADSDGNVRELVPTLMKHGLDAFLPFEAQAGSDVEEFGAKYPKLGILGGLDKNALARGKKELNAELEKAERLIARGGYVPGFDHLIPPNATWANYRYFVETLRKMVGV